FSLARCHEKAKDIPRTFEHYAEGNRHHRSTYRFEIERIARHFAQLRALFTPERIRALTDASADDRTPIFVIGMPRCGSTLLEQILSAHPDVEAASEMPYLKIALNQQAQSSAKEEVLAAISRWTAADMAAVRAHYL